MFPLAARWTAERTVLVLLGTIAIGSFALMHPVVLSGDEHFYIDGARAVARAARHFLGLGPRPDLSDALVGRGWFMPGTAFLFSPVFLLLGDHAPIQVIRLWAIALNLVLLGQLSRMVGRRFSWRVVIVTLAILALSPSYLAQIATAWSDMFAVHAAMILLLWMDRYVAGSRDPPAASAGLGVGLITYLRALYPPLLAFASVSWLLSGVRRGPNRVVLRAWARNTAVAALIFLGALLPWSQRVSSAFGPTLLITSAPHVNIIWLGPDGYVDEARAETGVMNPWKTVFDRIMLHARQNDRTYREQAEIEKATVLRNMTREEWLHEVADNIERFVRFDDTNLFVDRFFELGCRTGRCWPGAVEGVVRAINRVHWILLFSVGWILFAFPLGVSEDGSYMLPFYGKALVFLLSAHPFFMFAHGRYFAQLIPVFALLVAFAATGRARRYRFARGRALHDGLIGAGQVFALAFALLWPALVVLY